MQLNHETVNAHFELMSNPKKYGLPFRPLEECFEFSDVPTAQHILFRGYSTEVPQCAKRFFYLVMKKVYGFPNVKDANGNLGFKLRFVPKQNN